MPTSHRRAPRPGLFVALVLGVLATLALTSPAAATAAPPAEGRAPAVAEVAVPEVASLAACPANRVCVYAHLNVGRQPGIAFPPAGGHDNLHAYSCAGCISSKVPNSNNTGGDQMTSWVNNTGVAFCGYYDTRFRRHLVTMAAHSSDSLVSNAVNDELSSLRAC